MSTNWCGVTGAEAWESAPEPLRDKRDNNYVYQTRTPNSWRLARDVSIITVSRGSFSGGMSLAESVAKKLGYKCVSREVLAEAARQYGVQEEALRRALTDKPGVLERMTVERTHYLACIRAALLQEARGDNLVYHGHAGHLLLKGVPHVLKVRVVAEMEFRIGSAMERNGLTREEATRYIKKVDDERERWTRFLYHVDWRDPSLYDLVVNLDRMSIESASELLCRATELDEYKASPEWDELRNDLALAATVRARIAVDQATGKADRGVEITSKAGVVTIGGKVDSLLDAENMEEVIRGETGVKDVVIAVGFFKDEPEIL